MKKLVVILLIVAGFNGFSQNQLKPEGGNDSGKSMNAFYSSTNNPKFTCYPNPAKTFITVHIDNSAENTNYTLVNMVGKIVSTEKINGNQITIDVSALDDGIYILQITDVNGSTSKKVLVAKQNTSISQ